MTEYERVSQAIVDSAYNAVDNARTKLASLDRTVLGRWQFDAETLVHALATVWHQVLLEKVSGEYHGKVDQCSRENKTMLAVALKNSSDLSSDAYTRVYTEVKFWNPELYVAFSNPERLELLKLVASVDESYHDYFAAGIWDVGAVKRYVESDIDVTMALSLEAL